MVLKTLKTNNIPLYVCVCVTQSSLLSLCILVILSNAAMNIGMHVSFWISVFIFSGYKLQSRIAGW